MGKSLLIDDAANGGFPEPLDGAPVRIVAARHASCGAATRVRVPREIPARAVRRVHCDRCEQDFETDGVEDLGPPKRPANRLSGLSLPRPSLPQISLPEFDPSSRSWRLLSVPLAAALVIGGLLLVQGGSGESGSGSDLSAAPAEPAVPASPPPSGGKGEDGVGKSGEPAKNTELIQGSSYHLVLPEGWQTIDPPAGATFAAVSADGSADATLWIEDDPKLDFPEFVNQSLANLESLTGKPGEVIERVAAPTPEETIVRLAADAPAGEPAYEVLLRMSGPYAYYLATTLQPDASREAADGRDLIVGSMTPEAGV